jgi:hypothetical protein
MSNEQSTPTNQPPEGMPYAEAVQQAAELQERAGELYSIQHLGWADLHEPEDAPNYRPAKTDPNLTL